LSLFDLIRSSRSCPVAQFSVSTQLTTKSDLVAAAAAARAAVLRQRRYAGLTPMQYLDGADMSMLLHEAGLGGAREKTKIGKQVRVITL